MSDLEWMASRCQRVICESLNGGRDWQVSVYWDGDWFMVGGVGTPLSGAVKLARSKLEKWRERVGVPNAA